MRLFIALSLAALTAVLGCASGGEKGESAAAIENITWRLVELQTTPVTAGSASLRLSPADKRVTGSTGVNQFGGTYIRDDQALKFGALMMTRRAGPPELMRQESALSEALTNTTAWRSAKKDSMELLDAAGTSLAKFVAEGSK